MTDAAPFKKHSFTWMLGIEDTCVYPTGGDSEALDEHRLTGHTEQWRTDLALARDLGATALRYGVSWPLVHVAPGEFDWRVLDDIIDFAVDELHLTIVADLVHYGTPSWLRSSFADPGYPHAIEEFAGAFATRYRTKVHHFTPLNEPVTTASFCGLRGVWPPYRHGWDGWVSVAVPMALGIARSVRAIREANPEATIVHVEASTLVRTEDSTLDDHAELLSDIGWLPTDLIFGNVNPTHQLHDWLLRQGSSLEDLRWLAENPTRIDIIGVNYYPDLNPRTLTSLDGEIAQVSHDRWTEGLREAVEGFASRYALPIVITETSIEGSDELRTRWLTESCAELNALIADGIDIRGYTWWPLFDFVDWSWAAGGRNVEEFLVALTTVGGATDIAPTPPLGDPADGKTAFLRRMGVVRLDEQPDGTLHRTVTRTAHAFLELTRSST